MPVQNTPSAETHQVIDTTRASVGMLFAALRSAREQLDQVERSLDALFPWVPRDAPEDDGAPEINVDDLYGAQ